MPVVGVVLDRFDALDAVKHLLVGFLQVVVVADVVVVMSSAHS